MNKIMMFICVLGLCLPLGGCRGSMGAEATLPPGITKPEGGIVSTNPKIVEGRITRLTDDEISLNVQGVTWNMELSDEAQGMLARYKELKVDIRKGTFVMAYYEEENDGEREVTRIERVEMN
ncbi:MAG: hypothetical protein E7414_04145 [Ruminococcaceae bacterium]|nr:hypothetical protein [Oscillospiraceae bacterium]